MPALSLLIFLPALSLQLGLGKGHRLISSPTDLARIWQELLILCITFMIITQVHTLLFPFNKTDYLSLFYTSPASIASSLVVIVFG